MLEERNGFYGENEPKPKTEYEQAIISHQDGFGRVWSNLWGLITNPVKTVPRLRESDKIGWLIASIYILTLVIIGVVIFLIITFIGGKAHQFGFNIDLNSFFKSFFSGYQWFIIVFLILYTLFIILISILLNWVIVFFFGHLFASIYKGRGNWWQLAVSTLYLQLLSVLMTPFIILFIYLSKYIEGDNVRTILQAVIFIAFFVWYVVLLILITRDHYQMPSWRATITILTPIIIIFLIYLSVYFYFDNLTKEREEVKSDYLPLTNYWGNLNFNTNFNYNFNTNSNYNIGNINTNTSSSYGYDRLSLDKKNELLEAEKKERQEKVDYTVDYIDTRRMNELIDIKYDLLAYYEIYQKFPKSNGVEKLDGENDAINRTLKDFKRYYYGWKDPEYPKYYYGYKSDGESFELTCYLISKKEVFKLTN